MNLQDYYRILGIKQNATDDEIKKAYRRKAMEYHPDRNSSPDSQEMFIRVTEAYEYLMSHPYRRNITEEEIMRNYQAWIDYRREEARRRAEAYAKASYAEFRKSPVYRSTTVIDGTIVLLGLILATMVIVTTVYGYIYRMRIADTPKEEPSMTLAAISLIIGFSYLIISIFYLSAWIARQKKKRRKTEDGAQKKNN
ncbi:MAG TPA: DnaJ domain-containing protein [Bacteroidales bacterium]|nr:DnaJ domain-containing protein [Bacteroidales bacterium]